MFSPNTLGNHDLPRVPKEGSAQPCSAPTEPKRICGLYFDGFSKIPEKGRILSKLLEFLESADAGVKWVGEIVSQQRAGDDGQHSAADR